MTQGIWVQYETGATPYAGFIDATVTGDSAAVFNLPQGRAAYWFPAGTSITPAMQIDTTQNPPALVPIELQNQPLPVVVAPPPAVVGSVSQGTALQSLLQTLATAGIITNSTTA